MIRIFISQIIEHIVSSGPSNRIFSQLRYWYYSSRLRSTGGFFTSGTGFYIDAPENVSIGKNVYFCRNVFIAALNIDMEQILIGDDCLFGPNVVIVAANHNTYPRGSLIRNSGFVVGKIIIGNGCWIGANVTITSGVIIGNGSVIGANSVVTHNIPPYVIAAGTPAKIIRSREGKNIVLSCKVE